MCRICDGPEEPEEPDGDLFPTCCCKGTVHVPCFVEECKELGTWTVRGAGAALPFGMHSSSGPADAELMERPKDTQHGAAGLTASHMRRARRMEHAFATCAG